MFILSAFTVGADLEFSVPIIENIKIYASLQQVSLWPFL
jgi:hypothetical protein